MAAEILVEVAQETPTTVEASLSLSCTVYMKGKVMDDSTVRPLSKYFGYKKVGHF